MAYSTIKVRKKICKSCQTEQYIFSRGRCGSCAKREDGKPIAKVSEKTKDAPKQQFGDLNRWFEDRHKELTGKCDHCGGKSCKGASNYKCSIAHILPKRLFKSVATHPCNFIELCFWGNSCHTNMDNNTLDLIDLNCFSKVVDRFVAMYPSIAASERKYIPDILLQYIEVEK